MNTQPTHLVLESKVFNLSTRGSAGTILNEDINFKSRIRFDVPDMIVRDENVEYIQFSVPYAVIPISFYTINEYNRVLKVTENAITTTFTFPVGNYNATFFMATFKQLLNGTTSGAGRWNIILNDIDSSFTITNSTYSFTLLEDSTISSIMGFSETISSSIVSALNTLDLPRCCNFLSLPRVCMRCNDLANSNMVGDFGSSDIILSIPNDSRPNSQIVYQNTTQSKMLFRKDKMDSFIVTLTNDDGQLLNFNGISSFWTFQFDIYRRLSDKLPAFSQITKSVNSINNQREMFQEGE
jgi:hypothetical protein